MNAARLGRRWQEAAGDPTRMAEMLAEEIDDSTTGLVSRDFLRAELAEVRQEMATLRGDLRSELGNVRSEIADLRGEFRSEIAGVRGEIADLRGEFRTEVAGLRGELRSEVAGLRGELRLEVAGLRSDITAVRGDVWRIVLTTFGAQIALIGIMVTVLVQVLR